MKFPAFPPNDIKPVSKAPPRRLEERRGLVFPISRIQRHLRQRTSLPFHSPISFSGLQGLRVSPRAATFLAAVLEYICAEIVELSGYVTQRRLSFPFSNRKSRSRIIPRDISLAIRTDYELNICIPGTWLQ